VQHRRRHLLGLPFAKSSSSAAHGGRFGGKESQATHIAGIAALLAWRTGRPSSCGWRATTTW